MADNNPESPNSPQDIPTASSAFYRGNAPTVRWSEGAAMSAAGFPERIGNYRIIRVVGEGGMGMVLEAEQDKPRRIVALKVIRPGVATTNSLKRFELESETLGLLKHPGIAQVFEAGTFNVGGGLQPYFAMEFVRGRSLTDYAREHHLGTRERLQLMIKVCEAVQHAHQKGVIHRDLKPGNILVEDDGQPKILDFGVARLTASDIQSTTQRTDIGQLIGTIPYMSPEQTEGDPLRLDTRSDVYALGVICYELLADRLPYNLHQKMIHEAVRTIREDEPTPLSSVNRIFRGDVETIVAKALEKDRDRRYQSATELASDIERYLKDEPIFAKPTTQWYRLKKFARRNKALVGGVTATMLALTGGLGASLILLQQTNQARINEAEQTKVAKDNADKASKAEQAEKQRADELQKVSDFQSSMLSDIDPEDMGRKIFSEQKRLVEDGLRRRWVEDEGGRMRRMTDDEVTTAVQQFAHAAAPANPVDLARDMMDEAILKPALAAIERDFADQPSVDASLRNSIGSTYQKLGLDSAAEQQVRLALDRRRRLHGEEHHDVATSINNLAVVLLIKGDHTSAELMLRQALAMRRKLLGAEHPDVAQSINNLAWLLYEKGDFTVAEPLYREALALKRKILGDEHPDVAATIHNLALLLRAKGDYAAAEPLCREALAMRRKLIGDEHPDVAASINNLAGLLKDKGDYAAAEPLFREAMTLCRKLLGDEHPRVALSINNLAVVLLAKGDYAAAEPFLREGLAMQRKLLGSEHPDLAPTINNLAGLLKDKGDYAASEPLFREALAMCRKLLGDDHPHVATCMTSLAGLMGAKGDYAAAEPLFLESLAMRRRLLGDDHPYVAQSINNLAGLLLDKGDAAAAEPLYREALAMRRRLLGDEHPNTLNSMTGLAKTLVKLQRFEEAKPICLNLCDRRAARFGPAHEQTAGAINILIELYDAWHIAEPDNGYDAKAAEWQAKLTELQSAATTMPESSATRPSNAAALHP